MTTPARQAALKAFRDYITDDCDGDSSGVDRELFIRGYLRGRGDAHQAELSRSQELERLLSLADGTEPGQWLPKITRRPIDD